MQERSTAEDKTDPRQDTQQKEKEGRVPVSRTYISNPEGRKPLLQFQLHQILMS